MMSNSQRDERMGHASETHGQRHSLSGVAAANPRHLRHRRSSGRFRTSDVSDFGQARLWGGVWGCSPGTFELTFGWDEMSYLLEGEITIEQDGAPPITLRPGDFLMCPKGTRSRWTVKKACKKVFVLRSPEPMG